MTTAKPLARYSAVKGALASGFATAELHHLSGHDLCEAKVMLKSDARSQQNTISSASPSGRPIAFLYL